MSLAPVSVIVPVFNGARYILEAIDSIASQTVSVQEIIVVDNGSTDDTPALMCNDGRVQYVRIEERGVSAARNFGLTIANGEFVAFLDADDRWRPQMVERQLGLLQAAPALAASFTNFVRFDDTGRTNYLDQFTCYPELQHFPTIEGPVPLSRVIDLDAFDALVSMHEIPAYPQVLTYRRSAIGELRFDPRLAICEDMSFALRVLAGRRVGYISEVLAEVRRHDENATRDVAGMAAHKLKALLSIAHSVPAGSAAQYRDRLVKAHIDAARGAVQAGRFRSGAQYTLSGWMVPGSFSRKIKGTARIGVSAVQRMARGT